MCGSECHSVSLSLALLCSPRFAQLTEWKSIAFALASLSSGVDKTKARFASLRTALGIEWMLDQHSDLTLQTLLKNRETAAKYRPRHRGALLRESVQHDHALVGVKLIPTTFRASKAGRRLATLSEQNPESKSALSRGYALARDHPSGQQSWPSPRCAQRTRHRE